MGKFKNKIFVGLAVSVLLALVFLYGGNIPSFKNSQIKEEVNTVQSENSYNEIKQENHNGISAPDNKEKEKTSEQIKNIKKDVIKTDDTTDKDKYLTDPVPEGKPLPSEPQDATVTDNELTCTLSVRCDTILNNFNLLSKEKADIVPKDGVIFEEKTVTFYKGESVFNVLMREMKRNKIHFEFVNVPLYNSAYIEGIANLYEFDCGELSGWMYKVNDWFPNYGSSRYELKDGDRVEWVYTCDLGKDVGGGYSQKNGN